MKICFTGKRPKDLCGYNREKYKDFVTDLSHRLYEIAKNNTETEFISGGAQGFDQMAFWAVNILKRKHPELSITNTLYIPFKGQDKKWLNDGLFGRVEYSLMIKKADKIKYLQKELTATAPIIKALIDRNNRMVDDSDMVIALYPSDAWKDPFAKGGTAECMKYAANVNKDILRIGYKTTPILTITETEQIASRVLPIKEEESETEIDM